MCEGFSFLYSYRWTIRIFLLCQQWPQVPSVYIILLPSLFPHPLREGVFPTRDPWPLPLVQEMANMPQKANGSVGLADRQLTTPPTSASSFRRWGLFQHDTGPDRGLVIVNTLKQIICFFRLQFTHYNSPWCPAQKIFEDTSQLKKKKKSSKCWKFMNSVVCRSCFGRLSFHAWPLISRLFSTRLHIALVGSIGFACCSLCLSPRDVKFCTCCVVQPDVIQQSLHILIEQDLICSQW